MKYFYQKSCGFFLFFLAFFLLLSVFPAFSATPEKLPVTIANFPIRLNGVTLDQENAYYPMLVYQGITYLPMTVEHAELLNLRSHWLEQSSTLTIYSHEMPLSFYSQPGYFASPDDQLPTKNLFARPVWYSVSVNDSLLDTKNQPYPVLNFRNITYFPLTWHFAVDIFRLSYQFTAENGLEIKSAGYNPQAAPTPLPSGTPLHGNAANLPLLKAEKTLSLPQNAFADPIFYKNGLLFYFINHRDHIQFWRRPLNGRAENIGNAALADSGYHYARLLPESELLFISHFGGTTMGSEGLYLLPENGASYLLSNIKWYWLASWQNKWIGSALSVSGPESGLSLMDLLGNRKALGKSDTIYYANSPAKEFLIQCNMLYALTRAVNEDSDHSQLSQINLETGEHRALASDVDRFFPNEGVIYYLREKESRLYRLDLADGKSTLFAELLNTHQDLSVYDNTCILSVPINTKQDNALSNLYYSRSGDFLPLAENISKWQRNSKYLVYQTESGGKQYIVISSTDGKAKAAYLSTNRDIDFLLNGSELIIWSWQDQKVHYFRLSY